LKHLYKSLTLVAAITLLAACVTQRKKDEAKGISLFFHNLQSKYNGYFNANELVRDATDKLEAQHVDNFNKILDVYPALAVDNPQSASPDLDKATEKVAVVATYHRPSHWVDDCYLLMGKAQYLKHDFESAEETFSYLTEVYNPALKRKRSKRDREAAAKEKKEDREKAQKEKKQERDEKNKEQKKAREEAAKEKVKAKEAAAKQAENEKEEREKQLKKVKEQEEEARKNAQKNKKLSVEERNEARRKANEAAAEERRRIRDTKKTDKKTEPVVAEPKKEIPKYKPAEIVDKDADKEDKTDAKDAKIGDKKKEEDDKSGIKPKLKGKPDNYFLRHRPCYQESVVWYARTLTERQSYSDAELLLNKLDRDPKTFKDVRAMSAIARAHLQLKQKNFDAAIPALENALSLSKKKKEKVRLAYILAQVYQQRGSNAQAFQMFDKVLRYNPSYEMEFNARLSIALNDDKSTSDDIASTLLKMGKDAKNAEYGGQIYFTLAQIALKKNDKPKCIEYLKAALAAPSRSPQQKAEAYYLMATLEYENENYIVAKAFYDSAATTFPKTDARQGNASLYASNLLDVARNIGIINLQDSLLRISGMTDKEKKEVAVRNKKAQLAAAQVKLVGPSVPGGKLTDIELAEAAKLSRFFGYDRENIKRGKKEFDKKWGTERRLEDNWNRSGRRSNGEFKAITDDVAANDITKKEVEELLKGVPKTDEEKMAAEEKVEEALFQLGTLYHDKLKNDKKAIETLDKHLARFPKTKHEVEDYYYLYLAYNDLRNVVKAKEYYEKIQEKFPASSYARLLKNSDNLKDKDEQTVETYYAVTYALFKDEKVKEAQERIPTADTKYGVNNPLKAKFTLLNAMCMGRLKGREAYVVALKEVIAKFPDSPEDKRAQEILRILEFGGPINEAPKAGMVDTAKVEDLSTRFAPNDDKLHYVIVILSKNVDIEDAKIGVSDFNAKYFRTENLNISSIFLSTETEIGVLVVRKFKDKATSLIFTEGVEKNKKDFLKGEYEVFAVSQDNYREILRQKVVDNYRKFYNVNYKK
jgi:hypothetical protein